MKLELKHLTPYLLHNLMLMIDGVVCEIEGFDLYQIDTIIAERVNYNISAVKPILRPLSDLTKEIEVNGEKFVPALRTQLHIQNQNFPLTHQNRILLENRIITNTISYSDMQYLISLHFDIYGLIEQGLAIDINDLKKSL